MTTLRLENIGKRFGGSDVLQGVNLEINPGEFFSFVGPSGCGKTTLLRIIAGLETPTSGKVFINGEDVTNVSPQKRNIGIVFQNYALFPHMSVYENVAYGLETKKTSKSETKAKVEEVLKKVRLAEKARVNVTFLSGGEQQRVSLARVIVMQPQLILFDEPLSNLDYSLRVETRNELKRLQKEIGITSVYVTHDQSEALALSDRIAVLNRGIIQQIGNPFEIYYQPANFFVAEFVGHANLFDAALSSKIFAINALADGEMLAVLPEELKLSESQNGFEAKILDVQFTGVVTEYTIEYEDKIFKSIQPAMNGNVFKPGDAVKLSIDKNLLRKVKN